MSIEPSDYSDIFLKDESLLYSNLSKHKDDFNIWVAENFNVIDTIESFDEVKPDDVLFNLLIKSGYKHKRSQCHYSAKAICILHPSIDYYTGFVERKESVFPIITHSFNYYNSHIIDFARVDEINKIVTSQSHSTLPHTYYGIKIPRNFVMKYQDEVFKEESMKPLLYEWYLERFGDSRIS